MNTGYFLKMIKNLRLQEEILLYGNVLNIAISEETEVKELLHGQYSEELLTYPYQAPPYDANAALWAAKTVYIAAQLILYRENKSAALAHLLPGYNGNCDASAILSADLCLRFLPPMLVQLQLIDAEDPLIQLLENLLYQWHYSAINYPLEPARIDAGMLQQNACLQQLYVNRIIENKKIQLAKLPAILPLVQANLGMFAKEFWNDFSTINTLHE